MAGTWKFEWNIKNVGKVVIKRVFSGLVLKYKLQPKITGALAAINAASAASGEIDFAGITLFDITSVNTSSWSQIKSGSFSRDSSSNMYAENVANKKIKLKILDSFILF